MASLFTQERMHTLIDAIAEGKSVSQASALAYGSRSKIAWCHFRNAKRDREAGMDMMASPYHLENWPEEGEHHWLDHAYQMAVQIAKLDFHHEVLAEIRQSTRPIIEGGKVQYEIDAKALADWQGDAELARTLGGLHDPFYRHDENGARIELRVRDRTSAALTIAALKAEYGDKWNVPEKIDVKKRSTDVVLVLGEKRGREQKPDTNLERADIEELRRLAKLPPKHPRPTLPVDLGCGGSGRNDPPERINGIEEPTHNPEPRPALPPPQPQSQPEISYARKRTNALDAVDRATGGGSSTGMPPGGFDSRGRPT